MDGLYNRIQKSDLNGAGWLIYSKKLRRVILCGSMYEVSAEAGSYHGKLLGLLAIHIFVLAVTLFHGITSPCIGLVACDNKGALFKAKVFLQAGSSERKARRHPPLSPSISFQPLFVSTVRACLRPPGPP
jgi:hypothetical protein